MINSTRKPIIGLLGGSFNPAHAGHLHIASYAKKRLGLKQIWFLPTAQNPLKTKEDNFAERLNSLELLLSNKNSSYRVCDSARHYFYSWQSIQYLQRHYRQYRFIWLMGADCWAEILRWQRWRLIFDTIPVAIFSRDPVPLRSVKNRAGVVLKHQRLFHNDCSLLRYRNKGWLYFPMPRHYLSSSLLRGDLHE